MRFSITIIAALAGLSFATGAQAAAVSIGVAASLSGPSELLGKQVELVIEAGYCGPEATTVIDLTSGAPELVRAGRGPLEPFGL